MGILTTLHEPRGPLAWRTAGTDDRDGASVHDVVHEDEGTGRVQAYLVEPAQGSVRGAVLFAHWFDPGAARRRPDGVPR